MQEGTFGCCNSKAAEFAKEQGKVVIELGIGLHALMLQPCKIKFSNMINIFLDS
jgi:hypothetical protein